MTVPTPRVSVVISAYKVAPFLEQCVSSVLAQSMKDFELILVDDGSPDETAPLCDRLAARDPRIRVIHKQNQGLGMARNTGLEAARGEWMFFLDGDDSIDPQLLEVTLKIADANPTADVVRFKSAKFAEQIPAPLQLDTDCLQATVLDGDNRMQPFLSIISPAYKPLPGVSTLASAWGGIYRRSIFTDRNIRFPSERELISEDYAFNLDYLSQCRAIAYTDYPLYHYRHNPASLSRAVRPERIDRTVPLCEHMERRATELGMPDPAAFGMGMMIGPLRTQLRHIFYSDKTEDEKRRMFRQSITNPYLRRIAREYPLHTLPLMQRIMFKLHTGGHYRLCKLLTTLRDRAK